MRETMRKEVEVLVDTVGLDDAVFALADHADAMALRLAALERGATVEARPATGAVAPKAWEVGTFPPVAGGQVRRDSSYGLGVFTVLDRRVDDKRFVCWHDGSGVREYPEDVLKRDPLEVPWTEPVAITPDPRIAELESRIAALTAERDTMASQLAKMTSEAIALREERDAMVENVATLIVERDGALNRRDEAEDREKQRGAQAESLVARAEAERDAAVKRADRERADVVAYLCGRAHIAPDRDYASCIDNEASYIEHGAHVGASEK